MPDDLGLFDTPPASKKKWFPCSEGLPSITLTVLVRCPSGFGSPREHFLSAYYNSRTGRWMSALSEPLERDPTHWRELDDLIPL